MKHLKKLTLLHSNDMHGDFMAKEVDDRLIGGVSMLSGYVGKVRREERNVVYSISGDMFRGSLIDSEYKGLSTVEIMNILAPDVVTLGNHEVDYGIAHLLFIERCAKFPIINANIYLKNNGTRLFKSHEILGIDGMKVLFIGLLTEQVLSQTKQDKLIGSFLDVYEAAAEVGKICNSYQSVDIDFTVLLTHIGFEADKELAGVYYATNRFGKAAETYAKFIDTPVATEDDILKYAFALFLNHDFEKSLEVVQKGLQKNGRHAAFNRLDMYNYTDLKRYDEAEKAANDFFNASDNADYSYLDYRYYGALLSALKKYDRAIVEYGKALEKDSSQIDVWREIADAYELKNDYAQAIAAYQKYYDTLSQDKKTPEALFQLGRLYYGQGTSQDTLTVQPADRMTALQAADSVFALVARQAPDSYLGDMWRARTHSAMDPETTEGLAKPYYEKVADMLLAKNEPRYNSALIECYSYLGYYYLLKSDYPVSKEYWNKILAIDPTNATAKKALDGIK